MTEEGAQRYGKNKATAINQSYIEGGEYRRKFDKITDNPKVNRILYQKAKEMLIHRSGTKIEDMYWLDMDTGKVVASALNETNEKGIKKSKVRDERIKRHGSIIAMHTHPESMPPSPGDYVKAWELGYEKALIICHDGRVFEYGVGAEKPLASLHVTYIDNRLKKGYIDFEAQIKAIAKMAKTYNIYFKEM